MGQSTVYTARDVAKVVSKATGRSIDAKRVRAWVRDNVESFDDDRYTAHQYNAAMKDRIVKGMTGASKAPRSSAASKGRTPSKPAASKPAATPPATPSE